MKKISEFFIKNQGFNIITKELLKGLSENWIEELDININHNYSQFLLNEPINHIIAERNLIEVIKSKSIKDFLKECVLEEK